MSIYSYTGGEVRGKKLEILRLLKTGPKISYEIYTHLNANTESQKANVRKALSELRSKGLVMKIPNSPYWSITGKGLRVLECLELLEEVEKK